MTNDYEFLKRLYYDPERGYIGREALYQKIKSDYPRKKISRRIIKEFMDNQRPRQINKAQTRQIKHTPIFSNSGDSYQIDLTFMDNYKTQNRGWNVILTCIDINTRYGYAYKSKNKTAKSVLEMLKKFYKDSQKHGGIDIITSDNGSEFLNKQVQNWMNKNDITHYTGEPGQKNILGKIERFNRTLKLRMENHFLASGKTEWYNVLDDLVKNYNNTYHSSIKMKPKHVKEKDERRIIDESHAEISDSFKETLISTPVRYLTKKSKFTKGSKFWSEALYNIVDITPLGKYKLQNVDGGPILRKSFSYYEIQPVEQQSIQTPASSTKTESQVNFITEEEKKAKALKKQQKELKMLQIDMK